MGHLQQKRLNMAVVFMTSCLCVFNKITAKLKDLKEMTVRHSL